jgi:PhzF family phenazine biosynthesis protein
MLPGNTARLKPNFNKKMTGRKSLAYCVADVFTKSSYKGNPLAVVFTDGNLESGQYENISKEFGYSETSFVYYSDTQKALNIRSFTPSGFEVDGAGHNLLGAVCAALIRGMEIFKDQDSNHFVMMKENPIFLSISDDWLSQTPIVKMKQKSAVKGLTVPLQPIANALGMNAEEFGIKGLLPTIVSTEVSHLMVPVRSSAILNGIKTDNPQLIALSKQFDFEGFYCFTLNDKAEDYIAESRFFNPLIGIDEDAATGTAAGPLAGFLHMNKLIKADKAYRILQGVKLNQPSLIEVMISEDNVLVGGSSVITMQGEIYV